VRVAPLTLAALRAIIIYCGKSFLHFALALVPRSCAKFFTFFSSIRADMIYPFTSSELTCLPGWTNAENDLAGCAERIAKGIKFLIVIFFFFKKNTRFSCSGAPNLVCAFEGPAPLF
jgi:hypothetical protein